MGDVKLRVGLVGCGGISGTHLEGWKKLNPTSKVVALCDIKEEAVTRRGEQYGVPKDQWYLTHEELLAKADVDAIDICVPNMAHAPIAINSLKAGKHVVCEKPLSPTPDGIRSMIAARDTSGELLMTAQSLRFGRSSQRMKEFLATGVLGGVYYSRVHCLRRREIPGRSGFIAKDESGGGPCIDIGVHGLDLALWLMEHPEPVVVSGVSVCKLGKRKDIQGWWGDWDRDAMSVEDFAAGFVRFADGSALSLEVSWLLNIEKAYTKIWLMGTEAGAEWPDMKVYGEKAGCAMDTQLSFPDDHAAGHHVELAAFSDAVLTGGPSPVPAEQSLIVARILDGIYRSQEAGKEVSV